MHEEISEREKDRCASYAKYDFTRMRTRRKRWHIHTRINCTYSPRSGFQRQADTHPSDPRMMTVGIIGFGAWRNPRASRYFDRTTSLAHTDTQRQVLYYVRRYRGVHLRTITQESCLIRLGHIGTPGFSRTSAPFHQERRLAYRYSRTKREKEENNESSTHTRALGRCIRTFVPKNGAREDQRRTGARLCRHVGAR